MFYFVPLFVRLTVFVLYSLYFFVVLLCVSIVVLPFCLFMDSLLVLFWLFCSSIHLCVSSFIRLFLRLFAWLSVLYVSCRSCGVVVFVCVIVLVCVLCSLLRGFVFSFVRSFVCLFGGVFCIYDVVVVFLYVPFVVVSFCSFLFVFIFLGCFFRLFRWLLFSFVGLLVCVFVWWCMLRSGCCSCGVLYSCFVVVSLCLFVCFVLCLLGCFVR